MEFLLVVFSLVLVLATKNANGGGGFSFDEYYYQTFGGNHLTILDQGNEVQLLLDQSTGAGFSSRRDFGSGYFGISMKIPDKNSTGVDTSFYLISVPVGQPVGGVKHYEVDIEFFGTNGNPHVLSTNVFMNDFGGKEQLFHLWFDPTVDFHKYEILWNQNQIVWFVDETPIRVWKNMSNRGVGFPAVPMHVEASIWNPNWLGTIDWRQGPFTAHYREFPINGCRYQGSNPRDCFSQNYYWNQPQYSQLSPDQQRKLREARRNYMFEDNCNDPIKKGQECQFNQ
nr:xyloglucan endotransglucosylase/hydrolase protein 2-like [Coffea arabica]